MQAADNLRIAEAEEHRIRIEAAVACTPIRTNALHHDQLSKLTDIPAEGTVVEVERRIVVEARHIVLEEEVRTDHGSDSPGCCDNSDPEIPT